MKTIVFNGASSAGCTSLVCEFAGQTNNCYQAIHVDECTSDLPPETWKRCCEIDEGWAGIGIAFNERLAALAQGSKGVIADSYYKLYRPIEHLFSALGRGNVFFVHMYCDLHEMERREKARGDRRIGLAWSQFGHIFSFNDHDLIIDSTATSPEKCVEKLIKKVVQPAGSSDLA